MPNMLFMPTEGAFASIEVSSEEDYRFYEPILYDFKRIGIDRIVIKCLFYSRELVEGLYIRGTAIGLALFFRVKFNPLLLGTYDERFILEDVPKDFSDFDSCNSFFEVKYTKNEIDRIIDLVNTVQNNNIILNPIGNLTDLDDYNRLINEIISRSNGRELFFVPVILPISLIKQHPCNIYLCSCENCHSNHKGYPRFFTILKDKRIKMFDFIDYMNLNENTVQEVFEKFMTSVQRQRFIERSKALYVNLLDRYFYNTIAWFEWVKNEYI